MIKLPRPVVAFMISILCGLSSCLKSELPIAPHEPGNITTATVDIDATYKYQVYFDLKNNRQVSRNLKTVWDLGFETSASGFHIVLNTSKAMYAMNTGKTVFESVGPGDTTGFNTRKKWDTPSGSMDSTAIADWRTAKEVYIVDMGFNEAGQSQGITKVQFIAVNDSSYTVRFANTSGSDDTTILVKKDTIRNLSFLSMKTKEQVTVEPPKNTWDIVFTQYTYIFNNTTPPTPYLVTGCLLNRYNTFARIDSLTPFAAIASGDISKTPLSADISTIGYDWKTFNGTSYTINSRFTYLIKGADGSCYKMHFTGFYNASGVKGNPQWEYQRL